MKKAMKIVLAMAMVLLMSGGAMAEGTFVPQGVALVSGVEGFYRTSSQWGKTFINLSNISEQTIQCRITVYDHDGNDVTHLGSVRTGPNGGYGRAVSVSTGAGTFEMPAHSTRVYAFGTQMAGTMTTYGHAVIEWKSSATKLRRALIGNVYRNTADSSTDHYSSERDINSGQPF